MPIHLLKSCPPWRTVAAALFAIAAIAAIPAAAVTYPAKPIRMIVPFAPGGGTDIMARAMAKLEMTHIAYKGAAPALVALAGGEVRFMFVSILAATPLIESGKVRVIGVSSKKRSPSLPHVPAVAETPGLAGFESDLWYGMLAPAKTPPAIVDKLYQETRRILLLPEVRNRFEPTGAYIVANSPAEFGKIIADDFKRWAGVIKAAGVKME